MTRIAIAVALLVLLGAGCAKPPAFQGPDDYVSPTTPPPGDTP